MSLACPTTAAMMDLSLARAAPARSPGVWRVRARACPSNARFRPLLCSQGHHGVSSGKCEWERGARRLEEVATLALSSWASVLTFSGSFVCAVCREIERCAISPHLIDLAMEEFDVRICYSKQRNDRWGRREEAVDAVPRDERFRSSRHGNHHGHNRFPRVT